MSDQGQSGLDDGWDGFFRPDSAAPQTPRRAVPPEEQDTTIRGPLADDEVPGDDPAAPQHALSDDLPTHETERFRAPDSSGDAEQTGSAARAGDTTAASSRWHHPFTKSLGWTALGTVLPGLGLLTTKWRKVGLAIFALFVLGLIVVGAYIYSDPIEAATIAVRPRRLMALSAVLLVGALLWIILIAGTHLLTRPRTLSNLQRGVGGLAVALLSFAVATPLAVAARYSYDQAALVRTVFGSNDKKRSQTRPQINTKQKSEDVWKDKPQLNLLLVGLDSNAARLKKSDNSILTDTMMIATINTSTGDMVLTQIPRNMAFTQFPKGSKLAEIYPDGFTDGSGNGDNLEYMANAIWTNVPAEHPDLFADTDYPGADALKLGMEGTLGMKIDYFVALNIDGLLGLINAMGGVRLNVNSPIALGANNDGKPPRGWVQPGPNKLLNGDQAMWYARSRYQVTDYDRMARQSCVVKAIVDQADPQTMLTRYEAMAKASSDAVTTDIPSDMLPHLVDLATRVKDGTLRRVLFVHGQNGYNTRNPNFDVMRARVAQAIQQMGGQPPTVPPSETPTPTTGKPGGQPSQQPTPTPSEEPSPEPTIGPDGKTVTPSPSQKPVEDLKDACAYNPK